MARVSIMVIVAALLFAAGISAAQGAAPADAVKAGVLTDGASESWTAFRDAAQKEASAAGVALDFRLLSPSTADQQVKTAAEMIAAGAQALAICPVDAAQQKAALQEIAGKVPLVLLNRDIADCGRVCFIGMDEKETGKKMAELVSQLVVSGMKIAAFVKSGDTAAEKARMEGLKEGLVSGEFILDVTKVDKGDRNLAWAAADELLTKRIELAAYVAFESYELAPLLRAATAHKMAGNITLIGFVDAPDMQEAFTKGRIQGLLRPDVSAQAKQTLAVLRGTASKDPAYKVPENGVIGIAPIIETTPNPMSGQEKMDALQIPRAVEEAPAPAPARSSFE